jgi:hypothetical protein
MPKTAITLFNAGITGITSGVTYHYRAVVRYGASSKVYGADATFQGTSIIVKSANVFRGYLGPSDLLIAIEYINNQAPYAPDQNPKIYFVTQLLSVDGTTILASSPLPHWGDRPTSIYLSAASSTAITNGAAYIIRMIGTYSSPPSATYTLTPNDWKGTSMTYLDNWAIDTAWSMNRYDARTGSDMYVSEDKLTKAIEKVFTDGVPYLKEKRPGIFLSSGATTNNLFGGTPNNTFDTSKDWIGEVGSDIAGDMAVFGNLFGLSGRDFNGMLILGVIVLVWGLLIANGVVIFAGFLIAGLMLEIGAQFRAIDIQYLLVPAVILLIIFVSQFFWDRR